MAQHTILFATDFSQISESAFACAESYAQATGSELLIAHVFDPRGPSISSPSHAGQERREEQVTKARLHDVRSDRFPDIAIRYRLLRGEPAVELLGLAEGQDVSLIVMGTHGRTGLKRLFMGSVAEKVFRGARCPVVLVKLPDVEYTPEMP